MTGTKSSQPIVGTWKLLTASTSHPDLPHPKSSLTTFAPNPVGLHYKAETTWTDGRTTVAEADFRFDGSWVPAKNSTLADEVSLQAIDDRNYAGSMRKAGQPSGGNKTKISSDGQTMLTEWELIGPGGVTITMKTVSERI